MRAVKSVTIDAERRVIITFLDGSTETLYPNLICCDAEALRDIIKELLEEKADAIVQTINNVAIAMFEDGADEALIKKLLVSIDPIQEGTGDPSPENVRPISGRTGLSLMRTGKNLLDKASYKYVNNANIIWGATVNTAPDGSLILGIGTYTFSCSQSANGIYIIDKNNNSISRIFNNTEITFTNPETQPIKIQAYITGTTQDGMLSYNYQLEIGSTATDYEPYKVSTYSVNWETEAGTVYGGSLDVITGMLIVNKKLCKIGDLTFTYNSQYGRFETTSLSSIIKLPPNNTTRLEGLASSIYTVGLPSNTGSNPINNTIAVVSDGKVYIRDERYDNAQDFITGVGEQTIMYPLAEPIEYQLSAQEITTLLGVNNIWADSGNILELEYAADTKLYIGESQSATLGSGRQTITSPEIQPVSEKTWEELPEVYKTETEEKETQEETKVERGE